MLQLKPRVSALTRLSAEVRSASQWIKASNSKTPDDINVEKLFVEKEVQKLLTDLTEIDLEHKVFRPRRTSIQQRSHFALMTEERLEKTRERMREEARRFLQFVPVKEPREESVQILAKDLELKDFDTSKFVFTDITFDATDQDRTVVVREPDGTLRTANPEEHDRMNRTYYQKPNRSVNPPPLFSDPNLQNALDKNDHEFVLDWACWFYEPDDPAYVRLSQLVFDRINESGKFHVVTSTRHFGPFTFYLALNDNIQKLLNYFGGLGRLSDCANLVRLQKAVRPDWRVTIAQGDSDEKIVKDFAKQNARFRDEIQDLLNFINNGKLKSDQEQTEHVRERFGVRVDKRKARITSANIRGADGPLGDLSSEYSVKVVKSEGSGREGGGGEENKKDEGGRGGGKGRWRSREKRSDDDGKKKE
ncbi:Mitochondrial Ribosomal Protein, Small [Caenorhabditis elegans]|uniref:Mitochondrial Ribosomal Protein, Small n=1 Tax=Caenorhabditis elegans TaxID=6239 RepID=Q9U3Q0_CAEEL|nr:Mitochondrial Ribosomal Protein, Small [Caenorhabditis elegans]CAB60995.1 Mitochondrial Ribosomal Protein, Small [Caenorhabditis elegans]|eukprot:NP_496281.1 Mitochondrial Ribosomal Protein, Small [Caenorhabditis elegans]